MGTKKRLLIALTLIITVVFALGAGAILTSTPTQNQIAKGANLMWEKTFGGTGDDRAFYAASVGDGYVVVGSSTSFEQGKTVACVVRFDHDGNQLWNHTYSKNAGVEFRYVNSLQDGFFLVGNTFLASGKIDGYIMKLDTQGNPTWNVTLKANEGINKLFSGVTDGNNLIVTGLTQPQTNSTNSQAWIIKLDSNGNVLWNKTFGDIVESAARAVTLTQDNCYMVAGYVDSSGDGNYDFLVLKRCKWKLALGQNLWWTAKRQSLHDNVFGKQLRNCRRHTFARFRRMRCVDNKNRLKREHAVGSDLWRNQL